MLQRHVLYLEGDQLRARAGVAPLAAFVRAERFRNKWTVRLD